MGSEAPERFVPSTEELRHWIWYGTKGECNCPEVCMPMRRLSDKDN